MSKVLVVDDSKAIRDLLSNRLSLLGFDVAVASNGSEALHLFLTNSFDFVLTDMQMPGMDGWTLAFHVKDKSPDTPVVLVTGEEKNAIMEKLKGSCVDSVLFKPFREQDIQEMVQKMLGHRALQRGILLQGRHRSSSSKV
jgi:CheY-like chemotaxis protein